MCTLSDGTLVSIAYYFLSLYHSTMPATPSLEAATS
jgi:hypothetical protein